MFNRFFKVCFFLFLAVLVTNLGFAYEIPRQDSKTKYFYHFGPNGDPKDGKEGDTFKIFFDVPETESSTLLVKINDPDSWGKWDRGNFPPDNEMKFTFKGKRKLDEKLFTPDDLDADYFDKSYTFGPYAKTQGEKVGDKYRFTLTIKSLKGDDLNLFNINVKPNSVESFVEKFTFVLLPRSGSKMYFYPEIPAGIRSLTVRNFDLDRDGGVSSLYDPWTKERYDIRDSVSGRWAETEVPISSNIARRLEYRVVTTNQVHGHAGLQFKDDKGNVLPIYFKKGKTVPAPSRPAPKPKPVPVPKDKPLACNQFVFDARGSFDEDRDDLNYQWDFGDGSTSTEPVVTHVYDKAGTYKVKLSVTDSSGLECNTGATAQEVEVNTPPSAAFSAPDLSCVGTTLTFNASATKDNTPSNLSYYWNFGDGTRAEGETVSKTFNKGGVYDVVLTVDDNSGTSCSTDAIKQVVRVNAPPRAEAGDDITMHLKNAQADYRVVFDGSGSGDPDRNDLSYTWDFGDGETGTGKRVEHVYDRPGAYTARLTVDDQSGTSCSVDSDSLRLDLNKAPVAAAGKPQYACQGSSISFDGSSSYGEPGETLEYTWNFGDGTTATGKTARHTYRKGGKYNVILGVNDGRGTSVSETSDVTTVVINSAPTASLKDVQTSCTGDSVTFDASDSRDPDGDSLRYIWDFGDGTSVEGKSRMSHKYTKGGSYNVSVRVDDGNEGSCSTDSDSVSVLVNTPPVANAGPNLACCQDQETPFDGSESFDADGDRLAYIWDFGDGNTGTGANVSHAFSKSGQYTVKLTVDDGSGTSCSSSTSSFVATANAKPVPVIKIRQ